MTAVAVILGLLVVLLSVDNVRLRMQDDDRQRMDLAEEKQSDGRVQLSESEIVHPVIPDDPALLEEYDAIMDAQANGEEE